MPTEVELKLSATPAAWAAVRRHRALAEANAGRARSTMITSRYYDTPAHELHERGIALRLRRRGARWLQTVKGAGDAAAGMHRRAEYEWSLSRASLEPAKLAETPWAELFAEACGRLAAVFTTDLKRTELALKFGDGTRATLSYDQGVVRGGRKRSPLCEIEIELVEGDARRLYDLALALCADIPLTLAHASKADQGYALLMSRPPQAIRADKVGLSPDVAAPQALAAIATDCLGQIGGNAEAMRAGRDGEILHQLRVGIRRMRSLLKLAAHAQDADEIASIDRGLVALGQVFGPARDWDVFTAGTLAAIAPHVEDRDRRGFQRLRLRASRKRRFHRAATQAEAGSQRFTCLLLALGRFRIGLELAAPDPPAAALARDALGASERRLRKRGKRLREADAAARHRVRVAAKKLRYAAEFLAPLFRHAGANAYIDALSRLQGTLGYLNDMAAAARLVDELLASARNDIELSRAAGIVRGWTAAMSARELERLPKSWRQFAKAKPFWN
jgi:inorganic triphosphatase YgiF